MNPEDVPSAWILGGPTASGKTAVAHALARRHGWDVLSADSMLVYAGMDIGTAKPTPEERRGLVYHGIDLVTPAEPFSAGVFLRAAREAVRETARRGRRLLVVGGTGLYLDLLVHGIDEGEAEGVPPDVRARWQAVFDAGGLETLAREAERRSPGLLERLSDSRNPRRLLRALERMDQGLPPLPSRTGAADPAPDVPFPALDIPQERLSERIRQRIDGMFAGGLVDEVRALRTAYPAWSSTARAAIGYAEVSALLDGVLDEMSAREQIATRTRRLARRQRTWLRHRAAVEWVPGPVDADDIDRAANDVARIWSKHGPIPLRGLRSAHETD